MAQALRDGFLNHVVLELLVGSDPIFVRHVSQSVPLSTAFFEESCLLLKRGKRHALTLYYLSTLLLVVRGQRLLSFAKRHSF